MGAALAAAAIGSAAGGALGGIVSSVLNYFNVEKTNDANAQLALENRIFQHNEALIDREWQTTMSNTAYQRSLADLDAAGLNPNLMANTSAAGVGNVGVPQGSTATMQAPKIENVLNGLTSAINAYSTAKLIDSAVLKNNAEAFKASSQDDLNRAILENMN